MNVANLENCRELYKLSDWDDTEHWHVYTGLNFIGVNIAATTDFLKDHPDYNKTAPAYDLGYILRKLPKSNLSAEYSSSDWRCETMSSDSRMIRTYADTPEDAAAKLAIELFKQGIIKNAQQK